MGYNEAYMQFEQIRDRYENGVSDKELYGIIRIIQDVGDSLNRKDVQALRLIQRDLEGRLLKMVMCKLKEQLQSDRINPQEIFLKLK